MWCVIICGQQWNSVHKIYWQEGKYSTRAGSYWMEMCCAVNQEGKKPKWRNNLKFNSHYIFQSGCNACHSLSHCRCRWSCHVILQLGSCHLKNKTHRVKEDPHCQTLVHPTLSLYSFPVSVSTLANNKINAEITHKLWLGIFYNYDLFGFEEWKFKTKNKRKKSFICEQ